MSFRLLNSLVVLATICGVSACSNTSSNKTTTTNSATKKSIEIVSLYEKKPKKKQVYASLLDQWNKQDLAKQKKEAVVKITPVKKRINSYAAKARPKPVAKKTVVKRRPLTRKRVVKRPVVKKSNKYKTPSFRAPVNNIRYASLSGDYLIVAI